MSSIDAFRKATPEFTALPLLQFTASASCLRLRMWSLSSLATVTVACCLSSNHDGFFTSRTSSWNMLSSVSWFGHTVLLVFWQQKGINICILQGVTSENIKIVNSYTVGPGKTFNLDSVLRSPKAPISYFLIVHAQSDAKISLNKFQFSFEEEKRKPQSQSPTPESKHPILRQELLTA